MRPHPISGPAAATGQLQRRRLLAAGVALAVAGITPSLQAQETLRQATMIVGSPAGGATDKLARFVADGLRGRYAGNVLVENKPGAGGVIAYEYVRNNRARDGSLSFLSPAYPIVITPHLVSNLPYDPLRDFVPVAITGRSGMTYVLGPGVPAAIRTVPAYLQWCRDNPKQALYAAQTGSSQHLVGSLLALLTKVPLENVSYKGDAPGIQDLLGGHVPAMIMPIASALPLVKAGQVRVLAVTRSTRSRFLPDTPTFQELGYKEMLFQDWMGVFAAAGTAPAAVQHMNTAIGELMRSEQGIAALSSLGFESELVTPEAFAEIVKADHRRYAGFIEQTRFKEAYDKATGR